MSALFDPLTIGNVEFANRIWVSPMCQYMAEDGFVGQWHDVHLGSFATGGTGLIMVEATGVVPEGRISIGCPSIEDDAHAHAFKSIIDFAHGHGVKMGIQLAHAGRKAGTALPWADHKMATPQEGGWQAVSSSPIAFEGYPEPRALTVDEIHQLTQDFASAAKRAIDVGFDVIELHAAHGYLMHQFYSPLGNTRTDEYGGSFENRIRFLIETVDAVKAAIVLSAFILGKVIAEGFESVKKLPPTVVPPRFVIAPAAEEAPVPPLATSTIPVTFAAVPVTLPPIGDKKVFVPAIV